MRAIVVDDEPLARESLIGLLAKHSDVEVVGECRNGSEALAAVQALQPDVLFLDIQMPEIDGFQVLTSLSAPRLPAIVFVTAFDQFAVQAFEHNALDYLLKPFSAERLNKTLERVRQQLRSGLAQHHRRLDSLVDSVSNSRALPARFLVTDRDKSFFVEAAEIEVIRGSDYYSMLETASGRQYLVRIPLKEIELRLKDRGFIRAHRSAIVNLSRMRELKRLGRTWTLVMRGGAEAKVSRSQKANLAKFLKQTPLK